MYNTTGHLDFYPNGGTLMPGCNDFLIDMKRSDFEALIADTTVFGSCHHSRSHEFYFKSILYPTGFVGYPCETYEDFKSISPINESSVLFCFFSAGWRQKVFIKLSGVKKMRGDINLIFHDTEGNTKEYEIASGVLSEDKVYTKYLDVEINPQKTKKVEFVWNKTIFTLLWARMGAEAVNIIHGEDGHW
ncbi:UNVERIFIED_CONTAM: hypothetical protein H355_010375 [Colinus virginianus]|nr:hypothetical protein H355_010375 [Colinus virginianus]